MTPATAVPVREEKRTRALPPVDRSDDLPGGMARTRHEWPHGHPRIDRVDLDHRLSIRTELPGVERDDIELRLEGRDLVIYCGRHDKDEVTDEDRSRTSLTLGPILRRIPMPYCVAAGDVQANFNEGVLRVELRRPAGGPSNGVKINVR